MPEPRLAFEVLIAQSCRADGSVRERYPGSRGLEEAAELVAEWAQGEGFTTRATWYDENTWIKPGRSWEAPADEDDLKGLRLPVVTAVTGNPDAEHRIMLTTSIETPKGSPLEDSVAAQAKQTPGTDVSASGFAAIVHAMSAATIGQDVFLEIQIHTGSFSYEAFSGLTSFPYRDEYRDHIASFDAILGVQQVATCDGTLHRHFDNYQDDVIAMFARIAAVGEEHGIASSSEDYLGAARERTDYGFASVPALAYSTTAPSVLLSHGYWDQSPPVGRMADDLDHVCPERLGAWVDTLVALLEQPEQWLSG